MPVHTNIARADAFNSDNVNVIRSDGGFGESEIYATFPPFNDSYNFVSARVKKGMC